MSVHRLRTVFCLLVVLAVIGGSLRIVSAQSDPVSDVLGRINALRTQSGLLPLAVSDKLTAAAQQHSTDMATNGFVDHTGSDGSTMDSRIRASGYGFWRTFGIWGENIYGGQMATADDAWNFWIGSQVHRSNLLNTRYREIGVGFATSEKGTYFTLNFGAQPNVLPFFVTGTPPNVTLLLTNEDNITTGDGVTIMGQATEMRIGEGTDVSNVSWRAWAANVPFTLSNTPGAHTITVELRDELKRGTKMTRVVNVADLPAATETVTPTATVLATTTVIATTSPTATATALSTSTAISLSIGTATSPAATTTLTRTPTPTLTPTVSPSPTAVTSTPEATSTPEPSATPAPIDTSTPVPTLTPTVQPSRPQLPTPTAQVVALVFPTSVSASRLTPPAPRPAPTERPLIALFDRAPSNVLVLICGLQIIAVAIGVVALAVRLIQRRRA